MSLNVHGVDWHAKTVRGWQLAILRFAVTLDDADRLAVMAIANEIDRLAPQSAAARLDFSFFAGQARSYAPLFWSQMSLPPWSCVDTLRKLMMTA